MLENAGDTQRKQLLQPQLWPRRQELQQTLIEPTLVKGVERINVVIVNP